MIKIIATNEHGLVSTSNPRTCLLNANTSELVAELD